MQRFFPVSWIYEYLIIDQWDSGKGFQTKPTLSLLFHDFINCSSKIWFKFEHKTHILFLRAFWNKVATKMQWRTKVTLCGNECVNIKTSKTRVGVILIQKMIANIATQWNQSVKCRRCKRRGGSLRAGLLHQCGVSWRRSAEELRKSKIC